jgi:hypothetical protein
MNNYFMGSSTENKSRNTTLKEEHISRTCENGKAFGSKSENVKEGCRKQL